MKRSIAIIFVFGASLAAAALAAQPAGATRDTGGGGDRDRVRRIARADPAYEVELSDVPISCGPRCSTGMSLVAAPTVRADDYQLVTKCKALLAEGIALEGSSRPFAPTAAAFGQSHAVLSFGDYTVRGFMEMGSPFADPVAQPRLVVLLVKGGNPVTGQVNYSNIGGIDLDSRPVGVALSVTSMAFVTAQVQGKNVSRVDFSCSLTKIQRQ